MKYIMFQDGAGRRIPVLFSEILVHSEVAEFVSLSHSTRIHPISAGFYSPISSTTFGKSESMGLESRPYDRLYILLGESVAYMEPSALEFLWEQRIEALAHSRELSQSKPRVKVPFTPRARK